MTKLSGNQERLDSINPDHIGLLNDTLRAPSAHNAQPWQIRPIDSRNYEIHYAQTSDLPTDLDDKDAYLTMGAFVETMALQAPNHNLNVAFEPELTRDREDLFIGTVAVDSLIQGAAVDPLSELVGQRVTNRNKYRKDPLPPELEDELKALGNTLVNPKNLKDVVHDASLKMWADPQYIEDLRAWFREDNGAEDGITPAPFNITKSDIVGLKFAFWRGSIKSKIIGSAFASRDVQMFSSSPSSAVVSVPEMTPPAMFEAGRKMLRSWVTIVGAGYSYQPFSVGVDERSAAQRVAEIAGVENPVALYRIGKSAKPPRGFSNRKPLDKVVIE